MAKDEGCTTFRGMLYTTSRSLSPDHRLVRKNALTGFTTINLVIVDVQGTLPDRLAVIRISI